MPPEDDQLTSEQAGDPYKTDFKGPDLAMGDDVIEAEETASRFEREAAADMSWYQTSVVPTGQEFAKRWGDAVKFLWPDQGDERTRNAGLTDAEMEPAGEDIWASLRTIVAVGPLLLQHMPPEMAEQASEVLGMAKKAVTENKVNNEILAQDREMNAQIAEGEPGMDAMPPNQGVETEQVATEQDAESGPLLVRGVGESAFKFAQKQTRKLTDALTGSSVLTEKNYEKRASNTFLMEKDEDGKDEFKYTIAESAWNLFNLRPGGWTGGIAAGTPEADKLLKGNKPNSSREYFIGNVDNGDRLTKNAAGKWVDPEGNVVADKKAQVLLDTASDVFMVFGSLQQAAEAYFDLLGSYEGRDREALLPASYVEKNPRWKRKKGEDNKPLPPKTFDGVQYVEVKVGKEHGVKTYEEKANVYAPASDKNDPALYAAKMRKGVTAAGITLVDDKIGYSMREQLVGALVVTGHESGRFVWDDAFEKAVGGGLAGNTKADRKTPRYKEAGVNKFMAGVDITRLSDTEALVSIAAGEGFKAVVLYIKAGNVSVATPKQKARKSAGSATDVKTTVQEA